MVILTKQLQLWKMLQQQMLIMMVILGLGLWFVHLNSPDDKNNKRKKGK